MKKLLLAVAIVSSVHLAHAAPQNNALDQQMIGIFSFNHDVKNLNAKHFVDQFTADYAPLFAKTKKVSLADFVAFQNKTLDDAIAKRREMSLKQAHVRFGVLNQDKDDHINLKEFQAIGLKTFEQFDKNQDGIVNQADIHLETSRAGSHDPSRMTTLLSMPMPSTVAEFIQQYGEKQGYVTLGQYLSARDQQFFATDLNKDFAISEQEYVTEFTERYDAHTAQAKAAYQKIFQQQFAEISKNKATIQANDVQRYVQQLFKRLDQNNNQILDANEL